MNASASVFFSEHPLDPRKNTYWLLALIETKGRGEWMNGCMYKSIQVVVCLVRVYTYIHMYLFG